MILVLHPNTDRSSDEFDTLMTSLRALENISTTVHEVQGEQQRLTEIYLLGDTVWVGLAGDGRAAVC